MRKIMRVTKMAPLASADRCLALCRNPVGVFTISHLPFSFALGVSEIEIRNEVATLTGRFSRFPGAGHSFYSRPKWDYKKCLQDRNQAYVGCSCSFTTCAR